MVMMGCNVARILYKEIKEGDLKKFIAKSNITKSGGGARDLRFGPYNTLTPLIQQMFPIIVNLQRKRNKSLISLSIQKGTFCWYDNNGSVQSQDVFFEPPTSARRSEWRITRVNTYKCFDKSRFPANVNNVNQRLLLLLAQCCGQNQPVWPFFIDTATLNNPALWNPNVANELVKCIGKKRNPKNSVLGYYDFVNSKGYCR